MSENPSPFAGASEFPNDNPDLHRGAVWVCLGPCDPPRAVFRPPSASVGLAVAPEPIDESPPEAESDGLAHDPALATVVQRRIDPVDDVLGDGLAEAIEEATMVALAEVLVTSLSETVVESEVSTAESPPVAEIEPERIVEAEPVADAEPDLESAVSLVAVEQAPSGEPEADESSEDAAPAGPDAFAELVEALVGVAMNLGATKAAAAVRDLMNALDGPPPSGESLELLVAAGIADVTDDGPGLSERFSASGRGWRAVLRGESNDLAACGDSTLDAWTADVLTSIVGDSSRGDEIRNQLRRRGVAAFGMLVQAA